jgi:dTDP-glucose 4,6-dehydratase
LANLLVTGGAGFIGTNFVHYWRKHHPYDGIVVLDALTYAGNKANLDGVPDIQFCHGDIRDYELAKSLLINHQIDTLVHFAAESHVDRSINGPDAFIDTNINGTHALLKAAKAVWLDTGTGKPHRFHHVSTDEVYGSLGPNDPPFSETTAYAPNSPYSASKAASDHLVRAYHHTYGLQTTTSNCSNNYGPYQFPEKLIPLFILNALHGKPLPIYGDGMNVRDWLYVEDHCRGIELILRMGLIGEVYNIGGGSELPNMTVIDNLCTILDEAFSSAATLAERYPHSPITKGAGTNSLKTKVKDRPGHDRRYAVSTRKIRDALGYEPANEFALHLATTIHWYIDNEYWWRNLPSSPS